MNTREVGGAYEHMAAEYLKKKGYSILTLNYRVRKAELDIVARDNRTLVFVEVKYRRSGKAGDSLQAITLAKQKRICQAALFYMNQYRIDIYSSEIRFDVIGIDGDKITHIENAFPFIK